MNENQYYVRGCTALLDEMFETCCAPIMEDYKKRHRA